MKCCLLAIGSRGDVAPLLTVGRELTSRGHEVHLVVLRDYAALAADSGLVVHAVDAGSPEAMWPSNPWLRRAALAQPGIMYGLMKQRLRASADPIVNALIEASRGCRVIVGGTASRGAACHLGGALDIPVVTVLMAPLLPASHPEQGVLVPPLLSPRLARVVSAGLWRMTTGLSAGPAHAMRRRLSTAGQGSPPVADDVIVCAASPTLAPGTDQVGWIPSTPSIPAGTGRLDLALDAFLTAHSEPVLMSFGSCPSADPQADLRLFRSAAGAVGRPLVVQTPLLPPGLVDEHTFNAPGADHEQLMARVGAVVHHGGAGTTMTAMATGTPAVVVPHLGDQAWYARRVDELGAGSAAPPRWRLQAPALVRCLRRALQPEVARQAAALAPTIRAEAVGADRVSTVVESAAGR